MRRQFLIVASPGYFHSYKSNLILKHTAARPKCPAVFFALLKMMINAMLLAVGLVVIPAMICAHTDMAYGTAA